MDFCRLSKNTTVSKGRVYAGDVAILSGAGVRCAVKQCFPIRHNVNMTDWSIPIEGFKSGTWVGVSRFVRDPPNMGFWMYMSNSTDVSINLGRTIAFTTHRDAMKFFLPLQLSEKHHESKFVAEAYRRQYDTIQFTRFLEYGYMKHEVVFTRLNLRHTPGSKQCMIYAHQFRNLTACTWKPRDSCNVAQASKGWT